MTIASSVIVVSTTAIAQAVLHVTSSSTEIAIYFTSGKAAFSVTLAVSVKRYFDHQSFGYWSFLYCPYFKNYWNPDCSFRYQPLLRFLAMVNHAVRGKHWERNATKEDTMKVWGITTRKLIFYRSRSGSRKKVRILTHSCFWLPPFSHLPKG